MTLVTYIHTIVYADSVELWGEIGCIFFVCGGAKKGRELPRNYSHTACDSFHNHYWYAGAIQIQKLQLFSFNIFVIKKSNVYTTTQYFRDTPSKPVSN